MTMHNLHLVCAASLIAETHDDAVGENRSSRRTVKHRTCRDDTVVYITMREESGATTRDCP